MGFTLEQIADQLPHAICTGCGRDLPSTMFRTDRTKKFSRSTRCKDCDAETQRARHAVNMSHREHAIADGYVRACKTCGVKLSIAKFPASPRYRGGSSPNCQECLNKRHAKWRGENPDHVREKGRTNGRNYRVSIDPQKRKAYSRKSRLKRIYGITEEDVSLMRVLQNNRCAICRVEFSDRAWGATAMQIDHDHETGKFRALLCTKCNRGLGLFDDDVARFASAISYLTLHRAGTP